ncbi:MAG: cell division protein FtsA [Victivallaceae bacterium]|nr:cell division protein FtsA [Victivallaceae bacterium]
MAMFKTRDIVTAIEIGTSKICVLVGEVGEDGRVSIIGRGVAPSAGSVVKGEVESVENAFDRLGQALEDADRSSNRELGNTGLVAIAVTGCGAESYQGVGTVFIKSDDHKVSARDIADAHENAKVQILEPGREIINSSESYFLLDGRRVRHPLNQNAAKLDAHVHIVHALTTRMDNFRSLARESGFEDSMTEVVFSPLADECGIVSDEERENGVLLIDIGAGTSEFLVEYNSGILCSGVLQIGFEHVANDLSIGLNLPIELCRKLLEDGSVNHMFHDRLDHLDVPDKGGRIRRIPAGSFDTVIDARLRELYEVVRARIAEANVSIAPESVGVLTGGGALLERSSELFRDVFDMSCRIGQPIEPGGAVTGIESPRYSTVWGALRAAAYFNRTYGASQDGVSRVINAVDGLLSRTRRSLENLKGSIKV